MDRLKVANLVNSAVKDTGAYAKLYQHMEGYNYLFCEISVDENMMMIVAINTEHIFVVGINCKFTVKRDGKTFAVVVQITTVNSDSNYDVALLRSLTQNLVKLTDEIVTTPVNELVNIDDTPYFKLKKISIDID